jgi:hypothetical protein
MITPQVELHNMSPYVALRAGRKTAILIAMLPRSCRVTNWTDLLLFLEDGRSGIGE